MVRGDSSYNLCLGNGTAIKAMANGTMCATCFVGCGAGLTGIEAGFAPDADNNLIAGTNAASSVYNPASRACDNVILGTNAGCKLTSGCSNVLIGKEWYLY